jgi:hypothetical protein
VRIYVGSPFRGENSSEVMKNVTYAQNCAREVAMLGHAPLAPHLHDPQFLSDSVPEEREAGLQNGKEWLSVADGAMFFIDRGTSDGMRGEISYCYKNDIPLVVASMDNVRYDVEKLVDMVLEKRHVQ